MIGHYPYRLGKPAGDGAQMGTNLGEAWELGPTWCETWDDAWFLQNWGSPLYIQYDISKGAHDDQSDFGAAYSRVPTPILGGCRHQPTAFHGTSGTSEPWKPLLLRWKIYNFLPFFSGMLLYPHEISQVWISHLFYNYILIIPIILIISQLSHQIICYHILIISKLYPQKIAQFLSHEITQDFFLSAPGMTPSPAAGREMWIPERASTHLKPHIYIYIVYICVLYIYMHV